MQISRKKMIVWLWHRH